MALKVGQRVTVLEGVSNRMDEGSTGGWPTNPDGVSRKHLVGKRGEIVEINEEGLALVDDQYKDGIPQGSCTMREWFREEELEVG